VINSYLDKAFIDERCHVLGTCQCLRAPIWLGAIRPATVFLVARSCHDAILTATVVLIKQNRLTRIEKQRAYLDLQLNLLTEQKTTKLIDPIEELRNDLPMVKNRHDAASAALQKPTDPHMVLASLDEQRETNARSKDVGETKKDS